MVKSRIKRRVNWVLLGGLLGSIVVGGVVVRTVHGWQMDRHAQHIRAQVAQAEKDGKPDEAIEALERYLMLNPEHQESLARLGKLLDSVADSPAGWSRALIVNDKVLSKDFGNNDLRRRVIALARRVGDIQLAGLRLKELCEALPGDADAPAQLGDLLLQDGQPDKAIDQYKASIKAQAKQTNAYVRLALVYRAQRQRTLADETIEKMVAAQPDKAAVYVERGYYRQLYTGQIEEAAADFQHAMNLAPKESLPLLASAELALARGRDDEARKLLERGRDEHPRVLAWYRDGGDLALRQGKLDAALDWIARGQRLDVQDTTLWHLRIEASRLKKDFQAAREDIEVVRKKPACPAGLADYLTARVDLAQGENERAEREFEEGVADPKQGTALRARCALGLADLAAARGQPDRQVGELRRAIQFDPSLRLATLQLGRLLLAEGKTVEALNLLQGLTQGPEPPPEAFLELARALLLNNLGLPEERRDWEATLSALRGIEKLPAFQVDAALIRADMLLAQGKAEDADRTLTQASADNPKDGRLWAARVALARRQGDSGTARKLEDEGVRNAADPTLLWLGTLQASATPLTHVSPTETRAALAAVEARLPTLPRARQIAILQALGRTGDVERYARQLAELQPADGTTLIPALELALLGRDGALVARIVKALRAWEGEGSLAAEFGTAAWQVRTALRLRPDLLDKARPVLEKIVGLRPSWAAPLAWLGRLEDQANHPALATKLYRQAFDRGNRNPGLLLRLLELLMADAAPATIDEADAVFRQIERTLLPGGEIARIGAEIARRKMETDRARQLAVSAQPAGPPRPGYLLWLAAFLNQLGDGREAIAAVRKAVEVDPVNPDGWVLWVDLLVKSSARQEAEKVLALIADRQPIDLQAVTQGQCEAVMGRPERAAAFFEQALKRDPEDVYVLLKAAAFYVDQKDAAKAKPLLERLRRLGPRLPEDRLKWVEQQLARPEM